MAIDNKNKRKGGGGSATTNLKRGRPHKAWPIVKARLDEIVELRTHGATLWRIAEAIGISLKELRVLRKKHAELEKALYISSEAREEHLVGRMWALADGTATSEEETESRDEKGELKGTQKKFIRPLPQLGAQLALLKHYHGWSDNPKIDNAVANALNEEKLKAFAYNVLNIKDTRDKS